ncbi:hypothetical protein VOLCADRAFT_58337 [Volvox carteri f. nagariensis]|uniref:cysteine--tRNA ligase n=1 Tax=Volvox carteri f. nagariensis TaxID=3068 RepID=D8TQ63_VOLCA|nr:uncharacterized protein VOLCADRAFT_58337 [Volvox carteri f. nagariensis]EFJ50479.1 hypothetical protein VOLCADRAFT_58337 [Volvox carteri f. nagariensis]|eukprot:XP_002948604.1 hypothetical protein VOLCADRAFT_58337 [Volvox carteri f. nagariensis]
MPYKTPCAVAPFAADLRGRVAFFNTMSKSKELFRPRLADGRVSMYVCGVTVYDYSHIGHARVYVAFDVLYRFLTAACGYDVQYVRNFTDIDDKIIARAQQSGVDPSELTERFIREFNQDMAALNVLTPTLEPRATAFVPQMISTITAIMQHGHAYAVEGGDVFFDVTSLEGYGRLSGRALEDNRAGERVAVDGRKRSPADFALILVCLGGTGRDGPPGIVIFGGWGFSWFRCFRAASGFLVGWPQFLRGRDLVFPHHENELAQSQAACGYPDQLHNGTDFVRYWLHNGFVNVDSEKMSKSLGNFFTIRDVLSSYHPLALRWFLLAAQYRAPLNYSDKGLEEASSRLYYVIQARADVEPAATSSSSSTSSGAVLVSEVLSALADDLNTPAAVGALSGPLRTINDLMTTKAGRKRPDRLAVLAQLHVAMGVVMELLGMEPNSGTKQQPQLEGSLEGAAAGLEQLLQLIQARQAKDFARSDAIRLELASRGILLLDTPKGTTWRPGSATAAE